MELKPGYKKSETGVIPDDWELRGVGTMGQVVTGKALAVNGPGRQRPYLRTKNVFDGRIDTTDVLTMPMTDSQFAHFMLLPGDVLLNEGQSLELVGRCAMYQSEYREPCAMQNQLLRFRARTGVSAAFASHLFRYCQQTGIFARVALQTTSIAHLGSKRFETLLLPWPPTEVEQLEIAAALSDADRLLDGLDRLIAKKRDLKQAAKQQLITGRSRLPGFHGKWEMKAVQEIATVSKGTQLGNSDIDRGGDFPHYNGGIAPSSYTSKFNMDGNTIAISEGGNSCGYVQFIQQPFWCGGHCYSVVPKGVDKHYLFHALKGKQAAIMALRVGSGLPNVQKNSLLHFELEVPVDPDEQTAIATVFSEMDAEIAALEIRRDKTKLLKQAMMQELLTGKIRLTSPLGGTNA